MNACDTFLYVFTVFALCPLINGEAIVAVTWSANGFQQAASFGNLKI